MLVDKGETPNKCTILPLDGHPDLTIVRFLRGVPLAPLSGDVFLHPEGEALDVLARSGLAPRRISLVDSLWKRLDVIVQHIEKPYPTKARIPEGFVTAYPRRNKKNLDPEGGLATIEALFIAAAFFGVWDETLLAKYHFGAEFLTLNAATFARHGVVTGSR